MEENQAIVIEGYYKPSPGIFGICTAGNEVYVSNSADHGKHLMLRAATCTFSQPYEFRIGIRFENIVEHKVIPIGAYPDSYFSMLYKGLLPSYLSDSIDAGFVYFTKASDSIYAGIFEARVKERSTGIIKSLSLGRFDMIRE